jgi:hypothetical protein
MSRKSARSDDPTSRIALGWEGVERLHAVLDTLSERQASLVALRFGLTDGKPRTLEEIGKIYGIDPRSIGKMLTDIMQRLRHPSRAAYLMVYEYGKFAGRLSTLAHGVGRDDSVSGLVFCSQCNKVPLAVPEGEEAVKGGRHRKYCSNACRQAAYRLRRTATGMAEVTPMAECRD